MLRTDIVARTSCIDSWASRNLRDSSRAADGAGNLGLGRALRDEDSRGLGSDDARRGRVDSDQHTAVDAVRVDAVEARRRAVTTDLEATGVSIGSLALENADADVVLCVREALDACGWYWGRVGHVDEKERQEGLGGGDCGCGWCCSRSRRDDERSADDIGPGGCRRGDGDCVSSGVCDVSDVGCGCGAVPGRGSLGACGKRSDAEAGSAASRIRSSILGESRGDGCQKGSENGRGYHDYGKSNEVEQGRTNVEGARWKDRSECALLDGAIVVEGMDYIQ